VRIGQTRGKKKRRCKGFVAGSRREGLLNGLFLLLLGITDLSLSRESFLLGSIRGLKGCFKAGFKQCLKDGLRGELKGRLKRRLNGRV